MFKHMSAHGVLSQQPFAEATWQQIARFLITAWERKTVMLGAH